MDTKQSRFGAASHSDGITRREAVLGGTGGLALALFALRATQARAQEATPSPAGGMPAGVGVLPGVDVNVEDMPAAPVKVSIYHLTLEAGTNIPPSSAPYPEIAFAEKGTLICPGAAGRYLIKSDGTSMEVGDEDVTVNEGDALYTPANALDGARNDSSEQITVLIIDFLAGGEATPTS
jgi:quercetin dioxygenase-like cupin family protein